MRAWRQGRPRCVWRVNNTRLSSRPHAPAAPQPKSPPPRPQKRRKRAPAADLSTNEFLPERSAEDAAELSTLDFDELLDEAALATKSTVVNRAPIMMAWAFIVAERLGFQRAEALSIGASPTFNNLHHRSARSPRPQPPSTPK